MNLPFFCCIPDFDCIPMVNEAECIAAGGYDNIIDCDNPNSLCPMPEVPDVPDGCYERAPTWDPDPGKAHHTLDVCEHTKALSTFITNAADPLDVPRMEPVSSHLSRAQAVGTGQDPCTLNEGFLTIDDNGDVEFLMCTGRDLTNLSYAFGVLAIPNQEDFENDEVGHMPLTEAEITFSTEAPFPIEANLFSQGQICDGEAA